MSDKRIIDLEAKQTLGSGDYLAADSAQGTYKVDANTNIMTPLTNVRNNVANSSASPDKYSSSTAYKVGDMVIHDDILYICTTACSAASWAVNSACFTATTLSSAITQLNSDLTTVLNVTSEITKNITIPSGKNLQYCMKKCGRIVEFKMWSDFDVSVGTTILTIPSKYLPINIASVYPHYMYITESGSNSSTKGVISISQNGLVRCSSAMTGWQVFEMTWIGS